MKIILIGIQGSGKSTQGNLLSAQLKIPYLSTGHIFRNIAKEKTPFGKKVKVIMNSGLLIPDSLTIEIVNEYLSRPIYKRGYILDGFPRTLNQAKKFINHVDKVVHIEIPDKEALWRLAYRNENRDDDTIEAIKKRIEAYKKHTHPVLDFYDKKGILSTIDGTHEIEEVNQSILKSLGKQIIKNRIKNWEQKSNTIIALVGMPGAGKTEAIDYLKKKGIDSVSFSNIVNSEIDSKNLEHNLKNHHDIRMEFRKKYGYEAFAKLSKGTIEKKLKNNKTLLIEGMRSWEEYEYLKKEFPKTRIFILAIYTDKKLRFARIQKRNERKNLFGEERDLDELINTNMGPTIAYADYMIKNNFKIEDLHHKLDETYREIYFS